MFRLPFNMQKQNNILSLNRTSLSDVHNAVIIPRRRRRP